MIVEMLGNPCALTITFHLSLERAFQLHKNETRVEATSYVGEAGESQHKEGTLLTK